MKQIILLINLIAINLAVYCQPAPEKQILDLPVVTADTLIRGIYLNFNEFQQNSPSIRTDLRSVEKYLPVNNIYDNMLVKRMLFLDSKGSFSPLRQNHWGVCDGKHVFINFDGKYQKISIEGKYCPFSSAVYSTNYSEPTSYYSLILNITNGEIISISINSIKELLKKEDFTLYKAFDQEKKKREIMYTYISLLNQTYIYK